MGLGNPLTEVRIVRVPSTYRLTMVLKQVSITPLRVSLSVRVMGCGCYWTLVDNQGGCSVFLQCHIHPSKELPVVQQRL